METRARVAEELRVGFFSYTDPSQRDPMASMPFRMARALEGEVGRLVTFSPEGGTGMERPIRNWLRMPLIGRPLRWFKWRFLTFDGSPRALEHHFPTYTYRRTLRVADRVAALLQREAERFELDAVFGCIVTWPLVRPMRIPFVFYTDATTAVVNATFPRFADRCEGFKRACSEIEDSVYERAAAVGVPAEGILESALRDHGLASEKGVVIPMGANVRPPTPLPGIDALDVPSRGDLRLLIVASDPARKRLDLALEATRILRERGWEATLDIVGRTTPDAEAAPFATYRGLLRQSDPEGLASMREAYASAHLYVLPSLGEGAAISPAEAAHFGRPSVVSDVAGLPSVVLDGETGRVLPIAEGAGAYADAIESVVGEEGTYRRYAAAALLRAQTVFTWEAWAGRIAELLVQATNAERPRPTP